MMAIPATDQAGKAAEVRALLVYLLGDDWRGPVEQLDRQIEIAQALLGEFAGMSSQELAAV